MNKVKIRETLNLCGCPSCGNTNYIGDLNCIHCGAPLLEIEKYKIEQDKIRKKNFHIIIWFIFLPFYFAVFVLLPQIFRIFLGMFSGVRRLPGITQIALSYTAFCTNHPVWILIIFIFLIVLFYLNRRYLNNHFFTNLRLTILGFFISFMIIVAFLILASFMPILTMA